MNQKSDKAEKISVSLKSSHIEHLAHIKAQERSISGYIQRLIEADMNNQDSRIQPTISENLLKSLFEAYTPALLPELKEIIDKKSISNQPRILHHLFDSLLDYLKYHYEDRSTRLALLPENNGAVDLFRAAEEKGKYGQKPNGQPGKSG